jgi:hypothetical protein
VNTVFQDYALFPHMNVGENVGYGLMVKKVPKPERERRVQEMLDMVQLPGLDKRKPSQLSGGQRQRVGPRPGQPSSRVARRAWRWISNCASRCRLNSSRSSTGLASRSST